MRSETIMPLETQTFRQCKFHYFLQFLINEKLKSDVKNHRHNEKYIRANRCDKVEPMSNKEKSSNDFLKLKKLFSFTSREAFILLMVFDRKFLIFKMKTKIF